MIYQIRHVTHYEYDKPVSLCYNVACLSPRDTPYQTCLGSQIKLTPGHTTAQRRTDYFGNSLYHFSLEQAHQELIVEAVSDVKIHAHRKVASFDLDLGQTCGQALVQLQQNRDPEVMEAREYVLNSPMIYANSALREFARPFFHRDRPLLSAVRALTGQIYKEFTYAPEATQIATPLSEVLEKRKGVCQDFAHLAIGCLRSLGFPARYISGYLETFPPPGEEKLIGSDASHAWLAVYSPGEGWFEFDPTNNNMPAEHHITTAWGRDYGDVSPLRGVFFDGGESQKLRVAVDVIRLAEGSMRHTDERQEHH